MENPTIGLHLDEPGPNGISKHFWIEFVGPLKAQGKMEVIPIWDDPVMEKMLLAEHREMYGRLNAALEFIAGYARQQRKRPERRIFYRGADDGSCQVCLIYDKVSIKGMKVIVRILPNGDPAVEVTYSADPASGFTLTTQEPVEGCVATFIPFGKMMPMSVVEELVRGFCVAFKFNLKELNIDRSRYAGPDDRNKG